MQLNSNSNKKQLENSKLFLMWYMEKYSSHDTSTQYFEQVLILNTQYNYEGTKGDQEKLLNNDMIWPYKFFITNLKLLPRNLSSDT